MVCSTIRGCPLGATALAPVPLATRRNSPKRAQLPRVAIRATAEPEVKADSEKAEKTVSSKDIAGTQTYKRPLKEKEKADIYLGFGKDEKRDGKGRMIKDDPKKYPDKEDAGFFMGVSGGWAGGEVGLWELREEVKESQKSSPEETKSSGLDLSNITNFLAPKGDEEKVFTANVNGKQVKGPVRKNNADLIYVGNKGKAQEGVPGSFIMDDARKYPDKEDVGIFAGVTGGFAGGEQGVKQFAEKGDVELAPPGSKSKQFDPLVVVGAIFGAAVVGGGYVLSNAGGADGVSVGSVEGVAAAVAGGSVDPSKLILAKLGAGAVGTVALVLGARNAAKGAAKKLVSGSKTFLVNAAFFAAVALAVKAVLEN